MPNQTPAELETAQREKELARLQSERASLVLRNAQNEARIKVIDTQIAALSVAKPASK